MNPVKFRWAVLLLASLLIAQARPAGKTSVAVYPLKAVGKVDKSLASSLTSLLNYELAQSSRLLVIDEAMLQEVMKRQAMNISDLCDDTMCQVEIGKLVQAQKMAVGDLIQMGSFYILTVKVIDIQKGTIETTTKDRCSCSEDQLELLAAAAGAKIRNYFGEAVPGPDLPSGSMSSPVQTSLTQGSSAKSKNLLPPKSLPLPGTNSGSLTVNLLENGDFSKGALAGWIDESSGVNLPRGVSSIVDDGPQQAALLLDSSQSSNYYLEKAQYFPIQNQSELKVRISWKWSQRKISAPYGLVSVQIIFCKSYTKFSRQGSPETSLGGIIYIRHTGDFDQYDCNRYYREFGLYCVEKIGTQFDWQQEVVDLENVLNWHLKEINKANIKAIKILITSYNNAGSGAVALWDDVVVESI